MIKTKSISERCANEIIKSFEPSYPLDIYALCKQIGIEVIDYHNLKVDGYLYRDMDCKLILVNSKIKNDGRKRFVIAHELGHYFLHTKETLQICAGISEAFDKHSIISNSEKQANEFAAELLAPLDIVENKIPNKKLKFDDISSLANLFDVSITSMAIKCVKNSKSESETLLCYKNNALQWYAGSEDDYHNRQLPSSAPYGSLLYDVLKGINESLQKKVNANVWNNYDGEVNEEVLMVGGNTWLVLLSGFKNEYY